MVFHSSFYSATQPLHRTVTLLLITVVAGLTLDRQTTVAEERAASPVRSSAIANAPKPNIIYVMADELGYYETGFMGGRTIQTPNLDRMAAEGVTFTHCYAGSAVCAPTRAALLTGKHTGHTSVRVNGGGTPLRADEPTFASIVKPIGYATGGFGKWGAGGRGSTGIPELHGFDLFVGYYDQVHAHSYYPPYLLRNSAEIPLEGNRGLSDGETYSHYVIFDEATKFIRQNQARPFLCYLPVTPPHGLFDIPDQDPAWAIYKDKDWPESARRYAAMVTMIDRQMGELMELLESLSIDQNTLVFFSGDNGGNDYFVTDQHPRGVHSANKNPQTGVEFRGTKGTLYEGGLRIPALARWPGKISPGRVSDHIWYFPDLMPTIAEVTGASLPSDIDGISLVPELLGEDLAGRPQGKHEYLYWELAGQTAIRMGNWKAIRPANRKREPGPWQLYNLAIDPGETDDVAAMNADLLADMRELAASAHTPAVEGTFSSSELHQRDRAAKFGDHPVPANPASTSR